MCLVVYTFLLLSHSFYSVQFCVRQKLNVFSRVTFVFRMWVKFFFLILIWVDFVENSFIHYIWENVRVFKSVYMYPMDFNTVCSLLVSRMVKTPFLWINQNELVFSSILRKKYFIYYSYASYNPFTWMNMQCGIFRWNKMYAFHSIIIIVTMSNNWYDGFKKKIMLQYFTHTSIILMKFISKRPRMEFPYEFIYKIQQFWIQNFI